MIFLVFFLIVQFFIIRKIVLCLAGPERSGPGALGIGMAICLGAIPFNVAFFKLGGSFLFFQHPDWASTFYLITGPLAVYTLCYIGGHLSSHTAEDVGLFNGALIAAASSLISGVIFVISIAHHPLSLVDALWGIPVPLLVLLGSKMRNGKRSQTSSEDQAPQTPNNS